MRKTMSWYPSIPSSSELQVRGNARGFTLVEILVTISMIAILMSTIYGIFTSVSNTKERLDTDSEAYHRARVIFDRFGREIRGAYFTPENPATVFRGGVDSDGTIFLELSTTAVSPLSSQGTGFALVRYTLEEDPEAGDNSKVMLRREQPLLAQEQTLEEQNLMRLAPGILDFRLRFYADNTWHEDWDAATNGLPVIVEMSLSVVDGNGRETPFLSAFELPGL